MENICDKNFRRVAAVMGLIGLLAYLPGCGKAPDGKEENLITEHEVSDVTVISMSCGHMERSYSYSFTVTKDETGKEGLWLFDAECFTQDHEQETLFEGRPVSKEDVETLLGILEEHGTVAFAEGYRKKKSPLQVMDETTYGFCLVFSDGNRYAADSAGGAREELENFFYRLAEEADAL